MIAILLSGGFFRSLQFTSINTIAYAEIPPEKMSRATTMVAVAQQLSLSTGVAAGALVVEITLRLKGSTTMGAADFPPAFIAISLLAASAALVFFQLKPDAGEEMTGRKPLQAKEAALRTPEPASEQV
jgi:predicted MFS family arabinose efflux permease